MYSDIAPNAYLIARKTKKESSTLLKLNQFYSSEALMLLKCTFLVTYLMIIFSIIPK